MELGKDDSISNWDNMNGWNNMFDVCQPLFYAGQ